MDATLYLCKIEPTTCGNYVLLINENPLKYFKWMAKKLKELHKNDEEDEDDEESTGELKLVSYEKREVNCISVRIVVSSKAKEFRSLVENKKYGYKDIEYILKVSNFSDLIYGVFNVGEYKHEESEIKYVKEFFNNTNDIIVLKRIKGENIFIYYLYSKNVKYEEVIELIKKDFEPYYEKNRFYVLDDDKEYYRYYYRHKGNKRHISLDKLKKEKYLNINNFKMKKYDTIWLENKLGIKLDKERFDDPNYPNELKGKTTKKIINTDYVDFTDVGKQDEDYDFSGDEAVLLTEDEIRDINNYKKMMKKKHGIDLYDDELNDDFVLDYEDSNLKSIDDEDVLHIVHNFSDILFTEIIKKSEVPYWKGTTSLLVICDKEIRVKDFKK